jgi:hypothetical protein
MGECLPSGSVQLREEDRAAVTLEFWDADHPHPGDEPRVNVTCNNVTSTETVTAGLDLDAVREAHRALGAFLATHDPPAALEDAIAALEAALRAHPQDPDHPGFALVGDDQRWRLHVAACSIRDMTFWVRELPDGRFQATEVETGVSAHGADAKGALDAYFAFGRPDPTRRGG